MSQRQRSCELKSQASGLKPQAFWGLLVKIVIAPDKFKEALAAGEVARAVARGVRRVLR